MATYTSSNRYRLSVANTTANRVAYTTRSYYQYTSKQGDTFQIIASKILNDGTRYWEIADFNPQIQWPDVIPAGTTIRIPR